MFVAFGVAFSINSNLGVSPVSSLPKVVSEITALDLGICINAIFTIYIILQIIILRKEFKLINLTQIIASTFFAYFTDFSTSVLGDFAIPTYFGQLVMLGISIILIAIGISLYVNSRLVNMPMEGLTKAISEKIIKKPFPETKIMVDSTVVIIAAAASLIFLRDLVGVREGTVISAYLIGKAMKPVQKVVVPFFEKNVYGEEKK